MVGILMLAFAVAVLAANIYTAYCRRREKRLYEGQSHKTRLKGQIIALSLADAVIILIVVSLLNIVELHWYNKLCVFLAGLLAEGLLVGLMCRWWNWKRLIAWALCALLAAGGYWGCFRYDQYLESITFSEYFYYRTYQPFTEGSLVVKMEEEPTLRFTDEDTLPRMDGATALYPVYAAIAQATYPESMNNLQHWDIEKKITCNTTGTAYRRIVDGYCDIIFVAGPSKEQEAYAGEKGVELVYTPIGREAFVFFVHPDNPIDGLTLEEIRNIYAGNITGWKQLGADGLGRILAYQRSEGSGSQTALERFVMRGTPLMLADKETYYDNMVGIVEEVSSYKNHKNAIGFSFRFYCTELMKGFNVKLLAVDGVEPTVQNIENGAYPLASYFYAVTRSDADENTLRLLSWITGPQGQALVEKCGYTAAGE